MGRTLRSVAMCMIAVALPVAGMAKAAEPESPAVSQQEPLASLRRQAERALRNGDPAQAAQLAARYFHEGGTEQEMRLLWTTALYQSGMYADAARDLQSEVRAAERAGQPPPEERLVWLLDCYEKLLDNLGAIWALERLVIFHPKRKYWAPLLTRTLRRWGPDHRLALDMMRLRVATDTMAAPEDYLYMARLSLQAGLPAEARAVLDQGYATKVLGVGPSGEVERQRELRDQVAKLYAEDVRRLAQPDIEASAIQARDGLALLNLGMAYVTHKAYARGIALMEQGIRIGVVNTPQDAKLRLAIAYLYSGQRTRAIDLLRTVGGRGGAADTARLWEWHARQSG